MRGLKQFLRSIQGDVLLPCAFVRDPRFSQKFQVAKGLPPGYDNFQLQYSDVGYRNVEHPEEESVLLYFLPLGASRLVNISKDDLARSQKVRIITVDKPGNGGTSALPADDLLPVYCDAIAALLRHLRISAVSIASHCNGTIFALHFLLHHTEFLSSVPGESNVFFGTPWIQVRSGTPCRVQLFSRAPDWFCRLKFELERKQNLKRASSSETMTTGMKINHAYFDEQVAALIFKRDHEEEGFGGMYQEICLSLLKRPFCREKGWGDWGNVDGLVPLLAQKLRHDKKTLQVYTFLAERDDFIGGPHGKAADWFDECWLRRNVSDVITYTSNIVQGSSHRTVWANRFDAIYKMLEVTSRVRKLRTQKLTGVTSENQLALESVLGMSACTDDIQQSSERFWGTPL